MDSMDRAIVNRLQSDFPISGRPFREAANALGIDEDDLIDRVRRLREAGVLSRFGPMYHAERLGGGLALCAMAVPEGRFEAVAEAVNAYPEVAHNYARAHRFNMWFVLATERPERIAETASAIERETGIAVLVMPKLEEFYVGLRFEA